MLILIFKSCHHSCIHAHTHTHTHMHSEHLPHQDMIWSKFSTIWKRLQSDKFVSETIDKSDFIYIYVLNGSRTHTCIQILVYTLTHHKYWRPHTVVAYYWIYAAFFLFSFRQFLWHLIFRSDLEHQTKWKCASFKILSFRSFFSLSFGHWTVSLTSKRFFVAWFESTWLGFDFVFRSFSSIHRSQWLAGWLVLIFAMTCHMKYRQTRVRFISCSLR